MSGDNVYQDADIVWVKLGSSWWPGEVCGHQRQPEGFLQQAKRKPYCVVKFFQEDSFECVKTSKHILPFNCSKKDEFIHKGHELFKAKKKFMEKFPSDVSTAERLTRSVTRSSLFFNSRPDSIVKAILGESPQQSDRNRNGKRCDNVTKIINITPNRSSGASPSNSNSPPTYKCSMCDFQSTRQNVMVLHRKSHTGTATAARRSSLINTSTMTSPNEKQTRNSSSSRTVAVGTSPPPLKSAICLTPVGRKTTSAPLNDTIVNSDKSSNERKKSDVSVTRREESDRIKQKLHIPPIVHSSCPSSASESAAKETICKENARKSEEIQKSLLADWLDEDKDDDDDDSQQDKVEKYTNVAEVMPQVSLNTPVSIAQEISIHKPSPKIRNIPKKDRRNIVFTDFTSSDEIINLDASSQQSSEDARQLEKSLRESLSPAIEMLYLKSSMVEASHAGGTSIIPDSAPAIESSSARPSATEKHSLNDNPSTVKQSAKRPLDLDERMYLPIEEPATVESSSPEVLTAEDVTVRSPIGDSFVTELCIRNSSQEEAATSLTEPEIVKHCVRELSIEKLAAMTPSDEKSPETTEISFTLESSASNVDASPVEPAVVSSTVDKKPAAKRKSTAKTSRKGKSSKRISKSKLAVGPAQPCASKITIKPSKVEPSISSNAQLEESCTNKKIAVQSHSPEPPAINEIERYTVQESTVEPSTEEFSTVSPSDMNEVGHNTSTVEEPSAEEPYKNVSVEEPVKPSSEKASTMEPSWEAITILELTEMQASAVEQTSNHSYSVEHSTEQVPVAEKSTVEPSTEEKCKKSSAELSAEEASAIEAFEAEPSHEEAYAMEPTPAGQPVVESTNVADSLETTAEEKHQSINSVSKGSLSCFDFQEEDDDDDILTSIAKFKKKYISPEKSYDFGKDSRPRTPDAQKLEMELKDNQLSADIESLLNTTKLTVELATPSRSVLQEVRTLPIKERGKRIFKSRNRNRVDSCSSVSTTSMLKVATQSSPPQSTDCNIAESYLRETCNKVEQSPDPVKTDDLSSQNQVNDEQSAVDNPHPADEGTMDDKVTNSEEEIVGRILFSPSEVYAPTAENCSPDHRESHVSSSSIVVQTDEICESNESGYANRNHFDVVVTEIQTQQRDSCDADEGNQTKYTFSLPQTENITDEEMLLQQEVHREQHVVVTESQTDSEVQLEYIFSLPHMQQEDHLENMGHDDAQRQPHMEHIVDRKERLEQEAERGNHLEETSTAVSGSHGDSCDVGEGNQEEYIPTENSLDKELFLQPGEQRENNLIEMSDLMRLTESHTTYIVTLPQSEDETQVEETNAEMTGRHHSEYIFSHPQTENNVVNETYLKEITIIETGQSAEFADVEEGCQTKYILTQLETGNAVAAQEFLQQEDQLNEFFVVEESDPIYEVEVYDAGGSSKPNDNNYEESNTEYEVITTEVTSIVDRISNDGEAHVSGENSQENLKSESVAEVTEVEIRSSDEGNLFNEIIQADSNQQLVAITEVKPAEPQDSTTPEGGENNSQHFIISSAEPDNEGPSDELNSLTESQSKSSAHGKNVHVEATEDESIPAGEESIQAETSSDETVISDAEAEFGSPTSMLEEERMLSRCRSETMTPVTNMEFINNNPKGRATKENVLKKTTRWSRGRLPACRRDRRLLVQSLHYDTQESTSNDVEQNSANEKEHNKEEENKEREKSEPLFSKTSAFANAKHEPEKEVLAAERVKDTASNKEDEQDSTTDSESEEDDISSPPIEPLQDESGDSEAFERRSTKDSGPGNTISSSKEDHKCEEKTETSNKSKVKTKYSTFADQFAKIVSKHESEDQISSESHSSKEIEAKSQTFYTVTQKTDTIIRLNKHSERPGKVEASSEAVVHGDKPEIDGEELSAAEALLLIPNQPSNIFDTHESHEPKTTPMVSESPPVDVTTTLSDEIKDELTENESLTELPKDILGRKRRSHILTPRKHIVDEKKTEKSMDAELTHIYAKIAKFEKCSQEPKLPKFPDVHKKTFAEQYEENFVLKYMKEQSMEEADSAGSTASGSTESAKSPAPVVEKQTPEKVHITVDISNPLSSQIASILGTNRTGIDEVTKLCSGMKRKQTLEDDIPSFIIKRPSPKTVAEAEAADRETIAQIQTLCPHVEITRKLSKDEQNAMLLSQPLKPQIINQQILRAGNNQPIITVTQKSNAPEGGVFDITSMPIVLSNEAITNEKLHLVITPTTNPQVIKQFQNQQQLLSSNTLADTSSTTVNTTQAGIPVRRMSNARTKRIPSRLQLHEHQQQNRQLQSQEQLNQKQYSQQKAHPQLSLQQKYHQQQQVVHQQSHQQQQPQHQLQKQNLQLPQQSQHPTQKPQRQQQQGQLVQHQHQFQQQSQQQHFQQQFQLHHQNQMQQQLQEEQQFLMQQHQQQQLLLQQQHQQQLQMQQQQQTASEENNQSISTEKQMGIDSRGNKYVIIKTPHNTPPMDNNAEPSNVAQSPQPQQLPEPFNTTKQQKPRQTVGTGKKALANSPLPHISPLPVHSPLPQTPPLPVQLSLPHEQIHHNAAKIIETFMNEPQPQKPPPPPPALPIMPVKKGRGRPPKPKVIPPPAKENATKAVKSNGKRSSGSICEPPRQRATRSMAANKNNILMPYSSEIKKSVANDLIPPPIYTTTHQQSQLVSFITTQQSIRATGGSQVMCTSSVQYQVQPSSITSQLMPNVMTIEQSNGPGVGYAVPSHPVPGYPPTFLLCELIDKKYKELSSRPLYLSADRTRFVEVPEECLSETYTTLTDSQREPNPDVLQVISSGAPQVLQPRVIQVHHQQKINVKPNDVEIQEPEHLSVEEEASALLCLQHQIVQEQMDQEQFIQQLVIETEEGSLQVATIETEEVQDNLIQQLETDNVVLEEEAIDPTQQVILNIGRQQLILDENDFLNLIGQRSASRNDYNLTPDAIQGFVDSCNSTNTITAAGEFNGIVCEQQQIVMHEGMLHSSDTPTNILTVALDETGLYSEEQFINEGEFIQIETSDGLRYISTASANAGVIFQTLSDAMHAKTSETSALLDGASKICIEEIAADTSKSPFETQTSTTASLEECLSAIGVPAQSPTVPTSLELPVSVTNPAIVAKTRTPTPVDIAMNEIVATGLCHHPDITSLPSMDTNEQELNYDFFTSGTSNEKVHTSEESAISDMSEYAVVSSGGNFDDPAR